MDKRLLRDLRTVRDALQLVIDNKEYQNRTGGKWFTSAPTEYEWKAEHQKKTDDAVIKAIEILDYIIFA